MPVKIGRHDRDLRDQPQRLAPLASMRIVVARRVETAERRNRRAHGVHRRRVFGKLLMMSMTPFGQIPRIAASVVFNSASSLLVGQMIVVQQVDDFLVSDFAGQFVDVVAAVDQLADVALDIAQAGGRGDDAFQALQGIVCMLMRKS